MKKLIVGFLCIAWAHWTNAQTAAGIESPLTQDAQFDENRLPRHAIGADNERTLPGVVFLDAQGQSTHPDKLRLNGSWILIVLDTSMPSAQEFLSALAAKKELLDERTTILLVGSDASSEKLSAEKEKLPGVRWLHSSESNVVKGLDLAAVPSMMGMRSDQKIAWKFSGIPNPPEKAVSMIQGWLRLNPVVEAAAP